MAEKVKPKQAPRSLTVAELLKHPEYPHINWSLEPTRAEVLPVAKDRGGPINISYEVHGHGPKHLVWIMGVGAAKSAWQRQLKDFGHLQGEEYSCFALDNRGVGDSSQPWGRYSSIEMAKDVLECLDHIGWTGKRELHVIGLSLGGMIAQELTTLISDRVASLTLIGTANIIKNETTFLQNLRNLFDYLLPKSLDKQFERSKRNLLGDRWQHEPDDSEYVVQPFPTNGDRLMAGELAKRYDKKKYSNRGFYAQVFAAGGHHQTPEQLATLADKIGRQRIMVVHGGQDKMITFPHGEILLAALGGEERGVTKHFIPDQGHVVPVELRKEFHGWVEELVNRAERLNEEEKAGPVPTQSQAGLADEAGRELRV